MKEAPKKSLTAVSGVAVRRAGSVGELSAVAGRGGGQQAGTDGRGFRCESLTRFIGDVSTQNHAEGALCVWESPTAALTLCDAALQRGTVCQHNFIKMRNASAALNCTELDDLLQMYYLPTMYSLEFCLGFLGNLLVILGYVFCLKEWKSINVYLFNLAVSDLIFLCTLPRLANSYATRRKETSPFFCITNRYILHVNLYSSILFMVLVSVDRLLLLQNPYRQNVLLRRGSAIVVSALTWVVVNAQIVPLIVFIIQDLKNNNWTQCHDFGSLSVSDGEDHLAYSLVLTSTGYVLPLLALFLASWRITHTLKAQEGSFPNRAADFSRPLCLVAATAAMFFALYTPYHVMRNVYISSRLSEDKMPEEQKACITSIYIITRPIAFAHSVVNPIFYFLIGDQFRELLLARVRALYHRHSQQTQSLERQSTEPSLI
ncbi:succinate receptor 1-like [Megalops cyprinoides]|uniref:succinate receptor 1-like n=1 Tax=Megalops cyprinoides TaxID=118141 RepID=UPI0018643786|nr:succinate receptor 1-like [Megalops cyprinoides]